MDQQQSSGLMGFWQHLDELKARLMRCLIGFLIGFVLCYFFSDKYVFEFLQKPLFAALPPDQHKLYFTSLFENFMTHLKIAGYSSLFLLCPFYFYQLWSFIAPGLHPRERKLVLPFILSASFFFIAGAAFAYYVLFPVGFKFFVTYGLPTDMPLLTIDSYYGTCLQLMLLFGLAFEMPVLMVLLGFLGILQADALKEQRKNAIIGITVVSAFIAPPDAVSMLLLMGPLILMYEGARIVISLFEKKRASPTKPDEYDPFVGKSK
jgi:sec-independent protein translocase protein TatC